jgi:hypothetical protein
MAIRYILLAFFFLGCMHPTPILNFSVSGKLSLDDVLLSQYDSLPADLSIRMVEEVY